MKNSDEIIKNVQCALKEDIGTGDATSDLIDSHSLAEAKLISRDNAILCGIDWFDEVFNQAGCKALSRRVPGHRRAKDNLH